MNERIKLLAEQATEVVPEKVWDENNGMYYSENRSRLNSEKFAELIVEKCLDIVAMRLYRGTEEICRQECKAIAAEIKQHFRVEE